MSFVHGRRAPETVAGLCPGHTGREPRLRGWITPFFFGFLEGKPTGSVNPTFSRGYLGGKHGLWTRKRRFRGRNLGFLGRKRCSLARIRCFRGRINCFLPRNCGFLPKEQCSPAR